MLTIQTQGNGIADASPTFVGISVFPHNMAGEDDKCQEMDHPKRKKKGSRCLFKSISIIAYCSTKTLILKLHFTKREKLCIKSSASMLKKPIFFFFWLCSFKLSTTLFHLLQSISNFCFKHKYPGKKD